MRVSYLRLLLPERPGGKEQNSRFEHKSDGFNSINIQMIFLSSLEYRVVVEEIESDNIVGSILLFDVEP